MTKDTKGEIVIFGGLAIFLLWVWLANRQAGAGTGFEGWPSFGLGSGASPAGGSASQLSGIVPVAGDTFAYSPGNVIVPPLTAVGTPNVSAPSDCGCGCGGSGSNMQFSSVNNLIEYLNQPSAPPSPFANTMQYVNDDPAYPPTTQQQFDGNPGTGIFSGMWN